MKTMKKNKILGMKRQGSTEIKKGEKLGLNIAATSYLCQKKAVEICEI